MELPTSRSNIGKLNQLVHRIKAQETPNEETIEAFEHAREALTKTIFKDIIRSATGGEKVVRLVQAYMLPLWAFRFVPNCNCFHKATSQKDIWNACDGVLGNQVQPTQCFFCNQHIQSKASVPAIIEILQLVDTVEGVTCFIYRLRMVCLVCEPILGKCPNPCPIELCHDILTILLACMSEKSTPHAPCPYSEDQIHGAVDECRQCSRPVSDDCEWLLFQRQVPIIQQRAPLVDNIPSLTLFNGFCSELCFQQYDRDADQEEQRIRLVKAAPMVNFLRQFRQIASAHQIYQEMPNKLCEVCNHKTKTPWKICSNCDMAVYCSRKCYRQNQKFHAKNCRHKDTFVTYGPLHIVQPSSHQITPVPEDLYK